MSLYASARRRAGARVPRATRAATAAFGLLLGAAACSGSGPTGAPASATPSAAPVSATPGPSITAPTPAAASPVTSEPALIEPPDAELQSGAVVGIGALGSFSFRETGQSAPWLAGTPIALPEAAPIEVDLDPALPVDSWTAAAVPSTKLQEIAAVSLGEGTGPIRFDGPAAGSWSVMVAVRFGDGLGSASYFWAVTAE